MASRVDQLIRAHTRNHWKVEKLKEEKVVERGKLMELIKSSGEKSEGEPLPGSVLWGSSY